MVIETLADVENFAHEQTELPILCWFLWLQTHALNTEELMPASSGDKEENSGMFLTPPKN